MSNQASNAGYNPPGLSFQMPAYHKPDDYLYPKGPWPQQPSGDNPCSMAPEVCENSIPETEWQDWQEHLRDYYLSNMSGFTLNAAEYAVTLLDIAAPDSWDITKLAKWAEYQAYFKILGTVEPYPALDDQRFTELIAHGVLSKLLCELDELDKDLFKNFVQDTSKEYWKSDTTHMRAVRTPGDDEYLAPAIVLLARPRNTAPGQEDTFQLLAIALYGQAQRGGLYDQQARIFQPGDGKAWQLAKYFALQGALIRLNLIDHTMVHFPSDAINAITKTALPKNNLLLQLLLPHLRLSLPVDNSVLEGQFSLLNRTTTYPFSPYPAKGDEIRKVFPFYWAGSDYYLQEDSFWKDRHNAFPGYRFALGPHAVPSRYCAFLNAYYNPILNFTRKVVQCLPQDMSTPDWQDICNWANYIASWIPGFPDGEAVQDKETLAKALAAIIWNVSVVHSADHFMMHALLEEKQPLPYIMRDQPPMAGAQGVGGDYRAKAAPADVSSARLCDLLFFMPHNTSLLIDCEYKFDRGILQDAVSAFQAELRATAKRLHDGNLDFGIKLDSTDKSERDRQCLGAGVQY